MAEPERADPQPRPALKVSQRKIDQVKVRAPLQRCCLALSGSLSLHASPWNLCPSTSAISSCAAQNMLVRHL